MGIIIVFSSDLLWEFTIFMYIKCLKQCLVHRAKIMLAINCSYLLKEGRIVFCFNLHLFCAIKPNLMFSGAGVFRRWLGHKGGALGNRISDLVKVAAEALQSLLPCEDTARRCWLRTGSRTFHPQMYCFDIWIILSCRLLKSSKYREYLHSKKFPLIHLKTNPPKETQLSQIPP